MVRTDSGDVELRRLGEETLRELLATAVADAEPEDVMPPVAGPPGWTPARRDAFVAWHRARRPGLDGPRAEATYAVVAGGEVVGSARLARRGGAPGELETGLWLGRSARGLGIGTAVLRAVLAEAARAGARAVVADTNSGNRAAIAALRRCGAELTTDHETGRVAARLRATG
ncbi:MULTISPECIES: GNAT family N-acetyltransferase [Streptomyces]|uniref:GNAT family N-acetyltransferase n=1 Tax=Streptomyces lycii TaxID=2654337 RepID=A0ABQ7FAT0_9ACTN|nr:MULTISPECIES: GNAT family protein [Streptomyces]KAF4405840.1 GNAT family N-acetyltransferase [Streptomyces lycii]PGH46721.1 GNAT family N-acetyltransferase [Streptomyces sp. Ru87]